MQGPNLKKLIIAKMSRDAVPPGGGAASAIKFLTTPGAISQSAQEATRWAEAAIEAVRQAQEPNPWKEASDEDIAAEIIRVMEEKKTSKRTGPAR